MQLDEGSRFAQKNAFAASYTVQSGDTLLAIGVKLGIDWEDLAVTNNLTEDSYLQIGDQLKVPSAAPTLMSLQAADANGVEISGVRVGYVRRLHRQCQVRRCCRVRQQSHPPHPDPATPSTALP